MKQLLYRLLAAAALAGGPLLAGCSDSDEPQQETPREDHFVIALVDDAYQLDYEGEMTLRVLQFAEGDALALTPGERGESAEQTLLPISGFTPTDVTFRIPKEVTTGRWSLWCMRGAQTQFLGTTTLDVDIFRLVRNVRLEAAYAVDRGEIVTIPGEGFTGEDKIRFAAEGQAGAEAAVIGADAAGITIQLPASLTSGNREVWIERGADRQLLGATAVTVSAFERIDPATLPEGTNLYGRVYSGGEALEGVPVSDGLNVVTSDAQGVWSMVSDRASDVVFVTLPRGYEAAADGPVPQFYHLLDAGRDRYDFALTATGTDEYVLLATADIQIDNSSRLMVPQSSLTSCRNSFVTDFAKTVAELGGRRVYGLSVGDMIFDKNMYLYGFGFPEYRSLIGEFGIPFFHAVGNHDYDRYVSGDHATKEAYRRHLGPTSYSVNLGEVHCIALDNVRIDNNGATQGVFGDGFYAVELSDRQLQWLEADLKTVADKSAPLMIWLHVPLTACRQLTGPRGPPGGLHRRAGPLGPLAQQPHGHRPRQHRHPRAQPRFGLRVALVQRQGLQRRHGIRFGNRRHAPGLRHLRDQRPQNPLELQGQRTPCRPDLHGLRHEQAALQGQERRQRDTGQRLGRLGRRDTRGQRAAPGDAPDAQGPQLPDLRRDGLQALGRRHVEERRERPDHAAHVLGRDVGRGLAGSDTGYGSFRKNHHPTFARVIFWVCTE